VLLPSLAYDMTYPWALPDCTKVDNLEPSNARRCTDFDATDPFISAPTGFYVLKGSSYEDATSFPQLLGARLCRPEGHFTFDLEGERLMPPNAELIQPPTPAECWTALAAGNVDVVTYAVLTAEEDIAAAGMQDQVVPTGLETVQATHVFVAKNNPRSAEMIGALNAGLAAMRANGEWFEIVSRHLSEREARLGQGG
jgi:polar amino acid transport system substrate-binding protein